MFFRLFVTVWGSTVTRNFLGRLRSKIKTAIVSVDKHFNDHKRSHFYIFTWWLQELPALSLKQISK